MIEAITDLFIERVPPAGAATPLASATRLLAVDASGQRDRLRELLDALEARCAVSASLIELDELGGALSGFDAVWLIAGPASDPAYCALLRGELETRFPDADVELLAVGADIDAAALRGGPAWRRRTAIARSAELLAGRLGR